MGPPGAVEYRMEVTRVEVGSDSGRSDESLPKSGSTASQPEEEAFSWCLTKRDLRDFWQTLKEEACGAGSASKLGEEEEGQPANNFNGLRTMSARFLFAVHALLAVGLAALEWERPALCLLLVPAALGVLEGQGIVRLRTRDGHESRWFSFAVLLFILSVAPAIWALQMRLHQRRHSLEPEDRLYLSCDNGTVPEAPLCFHYHTITQRLGHLQGALLGSPDEASEELRIGVSCVEMRAKERILLVEQTFVVVLIVGRWLMPSGRVGPDALSQLLLVWLAIGADIVDLFDSLVSGECQLFQHESNARLVMLVWSLSLLQFPIQLTGKSKKAGTLRVHWEDEPRRSSAARRLLTSLEFWSILLTTCFQDGPFLGTRIYLLLEIRKDPSASVSQTLVYFTAKNSLVVALQMYRLYGIVERIREETRTQRVAQGLVRSSLLPLSPVGAPAYREAFSAAHSPRMG